MMSGDAADPGNPNSIGQRITAAQLESTGKRSLTAPSRRFHGALCPHATCCLVSHGHFSAVREIQLPLAEAASFGQPARIGINSSIGRSRSPPCLRANRSSAADRSR